MLRVNILALHSHEATYRSLPPTSNTNRTDFLLFWQAKALPFLEQAALFEEVSQKELTSLGLTVQSLF